MLKHLRGARPQQQRGSAGATSCGDPAPYSWTRDDYRALVEAAGELGTTPEDLLKVFWIETRPKFNPGSAHCSGGYPTAVGLNQITSVAAKAMKISEAERLSLLDMTAAEQLPYVVRSFLAARGGKPFEVPPDAVTLYQTNIAPGTVPHEVLYTAEKNPAAYNGNKWLDADKDGRITRSDLYRIMSIVEKDDDYRAAVEGLHEATNESFGDVVILGLLLGGSYWAYKRWGPSTLLLPGV
jgi:hypothetical protein